MKIFSTVMDTERVSQSNMKKRRGRREIEMSRRRKRGTQEERDRFMQFSVPKVFSEPRHPQRFPELDWVEKGEGGNRGVLREKTESQKWERVVNILLNKNGY